MYACALEMYLECNMVLCIVCNFEITEALFLQLNCRSNTEYNIQFNIFNKEERFKHIMAGKNEHAHSRRSKQTIIFEQNDAICQSKKN